MEKNCIALKKIEVLSYETYGFDFSTLQSCFVFLTII